MGRPRPATRAPNRMAARHRRSSPVSGLTAFQIDVARLFFGLPGVRRLLPRWRWGTDGVRAHRRPTHDLDFFGTPGDVDVTDARDQFEDAVADRGWRSTRLHDSATLVRLHVTGAEKLIVEFAIGSAAGRPPVTSIVAPTFDPEELAGRKRRRRLIEHRTVLPNAIGTNLRVARIPCRWPSSNDPPLSRHRPTPSGPP